MLRIWEKDRNDGNGVLGGRAELQQWRGPRRRGAQTEGGGEFEKRSRATEQGSRTAGSFTKRRKGEATLKSQGTIL